MLRTTANFNKCHSYTRAISGFMATPTYTVDFVYVLTNSSMPGLVKVGLTSWLPEDRAKDLYTTSVPEAFEVAYRATTSWPQAVEQRTHHLLNDNRVNPKREFFRVKVEEAINAVRHALLDVAGIDSWKRSGTHFLTNGDRASLTLKSGQIFALLSYRSLTDMMGGGNAEIIDLWQVHSNGDLLEIYATDSPSYISGFSDNDPGSTDDPVPYLDRKETVANGLINGRERLMPGERLVWLPSPEDAANEASVVFEAESHCQIVSRTWSPVLGPHGLPLLLNNFTYNNGWAEAQHSIRAALSLPIPRTWAPRQERDSTWAEVSSDLPPPDYWLPQLKRRYHK
jgi:T5orf172 domain